MFALSFILFTPTILDNTSKSRSHKEQNSHRENNSNFCRYVSPQELNLIESFKSIVPDNEKLKIPYYQMITDKSVIGTLVVTIGDFICYNIFMHFAPVYLNKVLGLNVEQTGISSAIPYIGSLICKAFIGPLSDRLTCVSMLGNVRIFMCISQVSNVPQKLLYLHKSHLINFHTGAGFGVHSPCIEFCTAPAPKKITFLTLIKKITQKNLIFFGADSVQNLVQGRCRSKPTPAP